MRSVAYDPETETMIIDFHSGGSYRYTGVPEDTAFGLIYAASPGSYFEDNIRNGGYPYQKL